MVQSVLTVLCGVSIFLYGMTLMSDGLQKAAGSRMRSILRLFAKNRFVAVVTGTVVTSVIQSSAATTVMVVGFVNAGLLNLSQSVGIILGAHIGTTITGQLVAFKISSVIAPSIILGLILTLTKRRVLIHSGETLMGFGFLFLGMEMMNEHLPQLEFIRDAFRAVECAPAEGIMPILPTLGAVLLGLIVTIVIQSSSACTGIVIVLATSGLMDIYTATAIAMGSNIGTTVTSQIAAMSANRVAKQAALSNTLTQTLSVIIVIFTFWIPWNGEPVFFRVLRWLSPGAADPRLIANANTFFNIAFTLLLLPFVKQIAHLCEIIIPVKREEVNFKRLDPILLATPSIALAQSTAALRKMLQKAWRMVDCTINMYNHNDDSNQRVIRQLERREADVDQRQQELSDYLSALMQRDLTPQEAGQIPLLLHCTNDAERIGDHAAIIRRIQEQLQESERRFSPQATAELDGLHENLRDLADAVVLTLEKNTPENIANAKTLRHELVIALNNSERDHLQRIKEGLCLPEVGIVYLEILEEFRKVSRHLANITDRAEYFYEKLAKLGKLKQPEDATTESQNFDLD